MKKEWPHTTDYLKLQRLLRTETLSPFPAHPAQFGYVMAETVDNQPQCLIQAAILLRQGTIKKIAVPDPLQPYDYGYPGPKYCTEILLKLGIPKEEIMTISPDTHISHMNTQTELNFVAKYLKNINEPDVVIIAPWFHTLRSYITALSEFKNIDLNTRVFISSVSLDPYEKTTHSQGIQGGTRRKIFYAEVEKCASYKNLISIEEALEIYKKHRDKVSD